MTNGDGPSDPRAIFVAERKSGLSYPEIAAKHGTTKQVVIYHCKRAVRAGMATHEEIGFGAKDTAV